MKFINFEVKICLLKAKWVQQCSLDPQRYEHNHKNSNPLASCIMNPKTPKILTKPQNFEFTIIPHNQPSLNQTKKNQLIRPWNTNKNQLKGDNNQVLLINKSTQTTKSKQVQVETEEKNFTFTWEFARSLSWTSSEHVMTF